MHDSGYVGPEGRNLKRAYLFRGSLIKTILKLKICDLDQVANLKLS